jgi:membrane protease YdiL (CAAX protease family)
MKQVRLKIGAIVEVMSVFLLVVLIFHSVHRSALSRWEEGILVGQRLSIFEYGATLGIVLGLMALTRRGWERQGIALKDGKLQIRVIAVGFLPVLVLGGVLGIVNWRTWLGAGVVSAVAVGVLIVIGWALRDKGAGQGFVMILGVLALAPCVVEVGVAGSVIIKTLYFYLLVGPAEEVLFRGYIQSRLNEVFGKPYQFFGVKWGWGIVMASVLFGLWHVVWRPLEGGAWLQGMWTFFAGLIFGYVREKSRGVVASSVLHSVMNYLPLFDLAGV